MSAAWKVSGKVLKWKEFQSIQSMLPDWYLLQGGKVQQLIMCWSQWASSCGHAKFDPFQINVSNIINFLAELFETELQDKTINLNRSAISAYHKHIDASPVEKHPKVFTLLAGVFKASSTKIYLFGEQR